MTAGLPVITNPTGLEMVTVDGGGASDAQMSTATLAGLSAASADKVFTSNSSAVSMTLTAAQTASTLSADVYLSLTGNPAGAANATLPTVAALVAQITNPIAGETYLLRVINTGNSGTWTVVTNTGWTLTGTMTIATTTWRDFIVTLTSLTAATLQNVGGGSVI